MSYFLKKIFILINVRKETINQPTFDATSLQKLMAELSDFKNDVMWLVVDVIGKNASRAFHTKVQWSFCAQAVFTVLQ